MAAGVDTLVPVLQQLGDEAQAVPLTNAKGAFSRSLAEYGVAAMMHFNKQITRLQVGSRWVTAPILEWFFSPVGLDWIGFTRTFFGGNEMT